MFDSLLKIKKNVVSFQSVELWTVYNKVARSQLSNEKESGRE